MKYKCPDQQLLSVYFDGELSSPWKEKMESHLSGCKQCADNLEVYKRNTLAAASPEHLEEAQQRVWQKLEQSGYYARLGNRQAFNAPIWRRRVSIPIPAAAAAAALLFITAAFFWTIRPAEKAETPGMIIAAENDFMPDFFPDFFPVSRMEDVLQYIGANNNNEVIILRLPENQNFNSHGEPAIIRAADYSRNNSPGRR